MRNIKLTLTYDGTDYFGFQRQPFGRTIQETIEYSLFKITKEKVNLIGCSRTDARVHAREYVANFKTENTIPPDRFSYVLNTCLPEDIIIIKSDEVPLKFHSRYDTIGKTYIYTIFCSPLKNPMNRDYSYHCKYKLNISLMKEAANYFIGKKDFSAFKSTGSTAKTSVREIKELMVYEDGDYIKILVTADGFLYNMVRIIAGTLLKVGENKISPDRIEKIILEGDRKKAGEVLPPQGLILEKVYYNS